MLPSRLFPGIIFFANVYGAVEPTKPVPRRLEAEFAGMASRYTVKPI